MKLKTARQIICDVTGAVVGRVALASGRTVESIQKEAKNIHRKLNKRERIRRVKSG